jgi:hypothetical protein
VLSSLLAFSAALLVLCASPTLAAQGRIFTGSFGGEGSGSTVDPYPLSEPTSVAVSTAGPSAGDVYVADEGNHRVEKFTATGQFILMFGEDVNKTEVEKGAGEAERDICTAGETCQTGVEGTGPGAFTSRPAGEPLNYYDSDLYVTVDNSSGPSSGDVYVADTIMEPKESGSDLSPGEGAISKFNEDGQLLSSSWGSGGQLRGSSAAPFGAIHGVAVDHSGNLWVYGTTGEEASASGQEVFYTSPLVLELEQDATSIRVWPVQHSNVSGAGIAVDSQGNVYLEDDRVVVEHGTSGFPSKVITDSYESGPESELVFAGQGALAVDPSSGDVYVAAELGKKTKKRAILRYESSCQERSVAEGCVPAEAFSSSHLGSQSSAFELSGLAINPSGAGEPIYVSARSKGGASSGEVTVFSVVTVPDVTTVRASGLTSGSATLNGTVNPSGVAVTKCFFEWGEHSEPYENISPCETLPGSGTAPVAVHTNISVQPGKTYHFRLVAANANDANEPALGSDLVLGPPRIDSTSVEEVTSTSATFQAAVNPQNVATKYHFEYLTEAEFIENGERFSGSGVIHHATSVPLSDAELGSGQEDLTASDGHVEGLLVHTVYRYRIVADSLLAEVDGPAEAFMTWGTGEFALPDGRQWEMVSPPDKHGALVEPIGEDWLIQAAAEGGRLAYVTRGSTESNPAGYLLYQSVLASRGAAGGWSSHDLSIPHTAATQLSVGEGWEYRFFSEDLSRAVVQPFGAFIPCKSELGVAQSCLSPEASEQTAFLASNYAAGGSSQEPCTASCYTPLVTGAKGYANVPPEAVFGQVSVQDRPCPPSEYCGPRFLDATPNASHVVLESYVALTESPAPKARVPQDSLYEWSEGEPASGQLRLVSVLPGNEQGEAVPAKELTFGFEEDNARHAISDDGARVVFSAKGHLYLRENAMQQQSPLTGSGKCLVATDACTIQLDAGLSGVNPQFQTANSTVTRIFFTEPSDLEESEHLTGDLYEYNVEKGEPVRMTTGAEVLGSVIGASEDGSSIYFVANGTLVNGAVHGNCTTQGNAGQLCNLYVMHHDGSGWEQPKLIAVLSGEDHTNWSEFYPALAARVSSNGEWLAFMSQRRLTGYDNLDVASGEPDQEVYEYDAATGGLVCASCSPTGSRPHGVSSEQINTSAGGIVGGDKVFYGWIAANVPGWTPGVSLVTAIYQSRYLDDSGRLFLDSRDQLVPKDINETEDVYEYEPNGVPEGEHACTSSAGSGSVVFKPARSVRVEAREGVEAHEVREGSGCVGLISSGESPQESAFLDASETGSEVFFLTTAKLSPQDIDTSYDVYDAHECTTLSPCASPAAAQPRPCETEASCKPAPGPQPEIYGPSGSATFSGPGDLMAPLPVAVPKPASKPLTRAQKLAAALKACRKDRSKRKRAACEKQARKRYGAKAKAKKARVGGGERRAGR